MRNPDPTSEGRSRLVEAIDRVIDTEQALREALDVATANLIETRERLRQGSPLSDVTSLVLSPDPKVRRLAARAIADYEHALMVYRATWVQLLVDECRMTLSDVARSMGVSRQMVSRLYRSLDENIGPGEGGR